MPISRDRVGVVHPERTRQCRQSVRRESFCQEEDERPLRGLGQRRQGRLHGPGRRRTIAIRVANVEDEAARAVGIGSPVAAAGAGEPDGVEREDGVAASGRRVDAGQVPVVVGVVVRPVQVRDVNNRRRDAIPGGLCRYRQQSRSQSDQRPSSPLTWKSKVRANGVRNAREKRSFAYEMGGRVSEEVSGVISECVAGGC